MKCYRDSFPYLYRPDTQQTLCAVGTVPLHISLYVNENEQGLGAHVNVFVLNMLCVDYAKKQTKKECLDCFFRIRTESDSSCFWRIGIAYKKPDQFLIVLFVFSVYTSCLKSLPFALIKHWNVCWRTLLWASESAELTASQQFQLMIWQHASGTDVRGAALG